ncbi:MAG: PAS domain S-box protein [Deltaproteobacteria bacterium]|nr:PAS domain S-box protein [Deltaproteobacteria bacterium]
MGDILREHKGELIFGLGIIGILTVIGRFNYLLFHSLAEMFSIIVSCGVFIIGWHSRKYLHNDYLLFVAVAALFVSLVDLLHTLAYDGMGVFPGHGPNLPTQLWIVGRALQAGSLLAATAFISRRLWPGSAVAGLGLVTAGLVWAVFADFFPDCYVDGQGLTLFKKNAEYVICLVLALSGYLLHRTGGGFDPQIRRLILAFIFVSILSELAFTSYVGVYGGMNKAGHLAKIVAFYFLYKAVFVTGVAKPHDLLFRSLTQTAQNLERHRAILQGFLDSVQESAFLMTPDGEVLFANQTLARRLGTTADRIVGSKIIDFVPPELGESRMAQVHKVLETGEPVQFEDVRDGRHVLHLIYPLLEDGRVTGLSVLGLDITERKQNELELRTFQNSMEYSPLSVVSTDVHGNIVYANPAFCTATGYCRNEAIGQNPRILKSGKHEAAFYREMWKTVLRGEIWRGEICNRRKNGELYWEQAVIFPVMDDQGKIASLVAMKEDISHRKDLERLKEDVDRIMRHDLKAPLNGIMGLPQILEMDDNLTEEQREIVRTIADSGQKMLEMIDLSLDLFKIERGEYRFAPEEVDALAVIRQVFKQNRRLVTSKKVRLRIMLDGRDVEDGEVFRLWARRVLLYSIISNLLANALEASPDGGEVMVEIRHDNGIRLTVHNSGVVPEPIRKNFFAKYNSYGKAGGTGLGTYSARLMAEAMGFEIFMETWDEDDRTEVGLRIPGARPDQFNPEGGT